MLSWIKNRLTERHETDGSSPADVPHHPAIIPRSEHSVSRSNISESALKVLYRLNKAGYEGYLVGGSVRDLLMGLEPKDFDIATSATPDQVRELFRNSRLIGRRFRLAHIRFGREIIEVATFRARHGEDEGAGHTRNGMIVRDNVFGTVEEDAWRRDFTINALYYNIDDFSVVDYTGGVNDIDAGRIRVIGEPDVRFREDPVRMLRAIRFAARLGFRIDTEDAESIRNNAHLLSEVPSARLFDEVLKLLLAGRAVETFEQLRHFGLFEQLFSETDERLNHEENHFPLTLLVHALENTDERVAAGAPVTPAFLFAALLWEPVRELARQLREAGDSPLEALQEAGDEVIAQQNRRISIPKRFSIQCREIWTMQARLERRQGGQVRIQRLLDHPKFRAAYDFLLLRSQSGEEVTRPAEWWTRYQEEDSSGREALMKESGGNSGSKRRRRGRGRRLNNNSEGGEA